MQLKGQFAWCLTAVECPVSSVYIIENMNKNTWGKYSGTCLFWTSFTRYKLLCSEETYNAWIIQDFGLLRVRFRQMSLYRAISQVLTWLTSGFS